MGVLDELKLAGNESPPPGEILRSQAWLEQLIVRADREGYSPRSIALASGRTEDYISRILSWQDR